MPKAQRILFDGGAAAPPPIPKNIAVPHRNKNNESPVSLLKGPRYTPSTQASRTYVQALKRAARTPAKLLKGCPEKREFWARISTELEARGLGACQFCGKEKCPEFVDLNFLKIDLERDGVFEPRAYDQSEEEIKGNAARRQEFYEYWWKSLRRLYHTETWTPDDFMYLPRCVIYAARDWFPAPMDLMEDEGENIKFSSERAVNHYNQGCDPLSPWTAHGGDECVTNYENEE